MTMHQEGVSAWLPAVLFLTVLLGLALPPFGWPWWSFFPSFIALFIAAALIESLLNLARQAGSLHEACARGSAFWTRWHLRRGASLDGRRYGGETPLHCASMGGHPGIIRSLLAAGADPNARRKGGYTPLYDILNLLTLWPDRHETLRPIVELLLEGGADPDPSDDAGIFPSRDRNLPKSIRELLKASSRGTGKPGGHG